MNIKTVIIVITITVLVLFTTGATLNNHTNNTSTTIQEQRTNTLTDKMLQTEFTRIHQLPYSEYQCRQKADLLKTYIRKYDKTGELYTVSIPHKNGGYSHVYVEYRGYAYDPTSTPTNKPLYHIDKKLWQQQLEAWGFTGQPIVRNGWEGET
mgnify:CR=1 FL=1